MFSDSQSESEESSDDEPIVVPLKKKTGKKKNIPVKAQEKKSLSKFLKIPKKVVKRKIDKPQGPVRPKKILKVSRIPSRPT